MALRDYQGSAEQAVMTEFEKAQSTLVVLPTGTGKTVLASAVIERFSPKRTMFIAHRDTLIYQARDTIEKHAGLTCDIEMAGLKADSNLFSRATVVLTTVQTQLAGCNGDGRMTKFNPDDYGLVVVDEAHHYTSPAWKKVLDYYRRNPKLKVLGITATPDRADEQSLGKIFETVAFDYEILDAVHDGWLLYPEQLFVKVLDLDISEVKVTAGDLNGADLAKVYEAERLSQGMVGSAIEIAGDRQFVFFTVSVAQAEMVSNIFNRHRAGMAEWLFDGTPKDQRRVILDRFKRKEIQGLVNVGILTEGWDDRSVAVCFMGRPTMSRSLYAQQAGRILRPLEGVVDGPITPELRKAAIAASSKPSALVVDFVGNSGKHKLMTTADILGGKVSDEAIERAVKKAKEEGKAVRMDELLDRSEEEIRAEIEKRRLQEEARKVKLVARVKYQSQSVNPFDILEVQPTRSRAWDEGRQLTEKQRSVLYKQGIDPSTLPFSQAKQLLNEIFKRWNNKECTYGQAKILRKHGYTNTKISAAEASAIIDLIAAREGWTKRTKVPA